MKVEAPKPTYTMADVRKMFEVAFKRKPEEMKDVEIKYVVDGIKPIEEGKEPMDLAEIQKRFVAYGVETHVFPDEADIKANAKKDFEKARLDTNTAVSEIKDPQKSLLDFCYLTSKEDNLSDIQIQKDSQIYK